MALEDPIVWESFNAALSSLRNEDKLLTLSVDEVNKSNYCHFCKEYVDILLDEGNYSCKKCSSLLSRYIDHTAEWRFYGNDDNKSSDPTRCGMPSNDLLPNSSLGSVIGYSNNENYQIRIMRKYHMWNSMTYKERSLYNIFEGLSAAAISNGISKSIIDEAKMLYKQVSEAKISRGDNRNGLIASSIYVACKNNKVPRSTKEIAKIFNLKITTMTKGCKKFQEIIKVNVNTTMAEDFIGRFCSKLGLTNDQKDICRKIVNIAEEISIVSENTPPSIAAGTIYLCNMEYDWKFTKKDLAEACDISQVTISKCFKKLSNYKNILFQNVPDQKSASSEN